MKNDSLFDKIEAWLAGELSDEAASAFEAEIDADNALAAEVDRHRRGRVALDRLAEQSLQQNMARWRTSMDELPPPPSDAAPGIKKNGWYTSRVWLGIILLMALIWAVWFMTKRPAQAPVEPLITVQKDSTATERTEPAPPTDTTKPVPPQKIPPRPSLSPKTIPIAVAELDSLKEAIDLQYGQTAGHEDEELPAFSAGVEAFKNNAFAEAKRQLLQIPAGDDYYPAAREMLAWLFFREKNYAAAARAYEAFASQAHDPLTDWRLLHFYLADYDRRRTDFWKKMNEMLNPAQRHQYRQKAVQLEMELKEKGVKRR